MKKFDPWRLSYPDFVGLIRSDNKPPGGEATLDNWIERGQITASSVILDLACSTGYSSRYIAAKTGCSATGIDLSTAAIEVANARRKPGCSYHHGNAEDLSRFDAGTFTHIVAGSTFGFIDDQSRALRECARVLAPSGQLLTSNFYHRAKPPESITGPVAEIIALRREAHRNEKIWREFYQQEFVEEWAETLQFRMQSMEEIEKGCRADIFENTELGEIDTETKREMFEVHHRNRRAFEALRAWQYYDNRGWRPAGSLARTDLR